MRIVTQHYRNKTCAKAAYPLDYEEKLKDGSIAIGKPAIVNSYDFLSIDHEGRYWLNVDASPV